MSKRVPAELDACPDGTLPTYDYYLRLAWEARLVQGSRRDPAVLLSSFGMGGALYGSAHGTCRHASIAAQDCKT